MGVISKMQKKQKKRRIFKAEVFRLMAKLLKVILSLKLEVRLTKVVRDSLWRHRDAKGTNRVRFRVKFITSKLNFIKKLN